jgi:hypothetical protein
MAIMDKVKRVRGAWSSKNVALGVFIDLKKAFQTRYFGETGALWSEGRGA